MEYSEEGFNLIYEDETGKQFRAKYYKKRYTFEDGTNRTSSKVQIEYFYIGKINKQGEIVRRGSSL